MSRIHVNNYSSSLYRGYAAAATSLVVNSSTGLPTLTSPNTISMTIASAGYTEIVKVTAISGTTLTVVRAQEGTTALVWPAGATVACRPTRDSIDGKLIKGDESVLTIASGVVSVTGGFHRVATEAAGATDDLDTINGGSVGMLIVLTADDSTKDVVLKDGTGNLNLAGDCTLDNIEDTITLIYSTTNSKWKEVCRSNNGA